MQLLEASNTQASHKVQRCMLWYMVFQAKEMAPAMIRNSVAWDNVIRAIIAPSVDGACVQRTTSTTVASLSAGNTARISSRSHHFLEKVGESTCRMAGFPLREVRDPFGDACEDHWSLGSLRGKCNLHVSYFVISVREITTVCLEVSTYSAGSRKTHVEVSAERSSIMMFAGESLLRMSARAFPFKSSNPH